jgi:hypothetical protein
MEMTVIAFLMGLLVFTEVRNYIERKGLLDRLMAKDFPEYATYVAEKRKVVISDNIRRDHGIEL